MYLFSRGCTFDDIDIMLPEKTTTTPLLHDYKCEEMDSFDISLKQTSDTVKRRIQQSLKNRSLKMSDVRYLSEATHDADTTKREPLDLTVYTHMSDLDIEDIPNFEILKRMDLQETDKYNTGGNQQNPSISIDNIDKCDAEN